MSGVRTWWMVSAVIGIVAFSVVPTHVAARSFAWSLTCDGGGSVGMGWSWTQGGVPILGEGGTPTCNTSGGGTRPASADGFTGVLSIQLCGDVFGKVNCNSQTQSVTKSFDPANAFKTTLKVSVSGVKDMNPCFDCKQRFVTRSASAQFDISS